MDGFIMFAQLILGISILVGLHEMGHLLAAKMFGMRVEKFSIGFPPKIFSVKLGETEYAIGALPLGGYVKISGMIDESLDTKYLDKKPKPYEYRSKPAWQRLIVMLGGIIVNVITGIVIFIVLTYNTGDSYVSINEVNKHGIYVNELGEEIGLKRGDRVVKINGENFQRFSDVRNPKFLLENNSFLTVERDGKEIDIQIPNDFIEKISDDNVSRSWIDALRPYEIDEIVKDSPADKAGLRKGDQLISAADISVKYFQDLRAVLKENKGKNITFEVARKDHVNVERIDVTITEEGTIGFIPKFLFVTSVKDYTLLEAIPKGTADAFGIVTLQLKAFSKMFRGDINVSKSLSGPIGIAKIFGPEWVWLRFWTLTGMLSMVLAFMNFLPIPALDGGHVVFLSYEIISGRTPSLKFLETSQKIGMVILLAIMVFAFGNDIYKEIFN